MSEVAPIHDSFQQFGILYVWNFKFGTQMDQGNY